MLIKVGDGANPEQFDTVGGLRTSNLILNNHLLDSSNVTSGAWRKLLNGAGIQSLRISGNGIFTDSVAESTLCGYAFSNTVHNYQFIFANGDLITGPFVIAAYERAGNYDGEEAYSITLESAGAINYIAV